jgi:hypothetical protein
MILLFVAAQVVIDHALPRWRSRRRPAQPAAAAA